MPRELGQCLFPLSQSLQVLITLQKRVAGKRKSRKGNPLGALVKQEGQKTAGVEKEAPKVRLCTCASQKCPLLTSFRGTKVFWKKGCTTTVKSLRCRYWCQEESLEMSLWERGERRFKPPGKTRQTGSSPAVVCW